VDGREAENTASLPGKGAAGRENLQSTRTISRTQARIIRQEGRSAALRLGRGRAILCVSAAAGRGKRSRYGRGGGRSAIVPGVDRLESPASPMPGHSGSNSATQSLACPSSRSRASTAKTSETRLAGARQGREDGWCCSWARKKYGRAKIGRPKLMGPPEPERASEPRPRFGQPTRNIRQRLPRNVSVDHARSASARRGRPRRHGARRSS